MVRGPMALFGAIIAVGLGPALWLGAQFGHIAVDPAAPRVPATVDAPTDNAPGRAAAAVDDNRLSDAADIVDGGGGQDLAPVANVTPSARTTTRAPQAGPSPSRAVSVPRFPPRVPSPPFSSGPTSPPPTEVSTPPAAEPTTPAEDPPSTPTDTPTTDQGDPTDVITADPSGPAQP